MEKYPNYPVFGSTGLLSMNSNHMIRRTLAWAKFENASVKLKEPPINFK